MLWCDALGVYGGLGGGECEAGERGDLSLLQSGLAVS